MKAQLRARQWIGQLGVFGVVGVINTLVDIALFWLLTTAAGILPIPANIVSFSVGAICSFTLNGRVTFWAAGSPEKSGARALRFALTTLVTLVASTASIALFIRFVPPMVAKLLSVGVSFAIGFLLQRNWVFAASRRDAPVAGQGRTKPLPEMPLPEIQPDKPTISR